MTPLSPKRRSELRAEAHKLRPTVLIGDKGLTDEVLAEIDRSLKAHELIKVRAAAAAREQRDIWLETICERLQAHPVQQIGKVFVIYRENPEEELGPGPSPRRGAGGDEAKSGAGGDTGKAGPRGRRESTATMKARIVSEQARERQRVKDLKKRLEREAKEAKGKRRLAPGPRLDPRVRGDDGGADAGATRTSRPRSRTPSPLPESGPRRRRPRTSR